MLLARNDCDLHNLLYHIFNVLNEIQLYLWSINQSCRFVRYSKTREMCPIYCKCKIKRGSSDCSAVFVYVFSTPCALILGRVFYRDIACFKNEYAYLTCIYVYLCIFIYLYTMINRWPVCLDSIWLNTKKILKIKPFCLWIIFVCFNVFKTRETPGADTRFDVNSRGFKLPARDYNSNNVSEKLEEPLEIR